MSGLSGTAVSPALDLVERESGLPELAGDVVAAWGGYGQVVDGLAGIG